MKSFSKKRRVNNLSGRKEKVNDGTDSRLRIVKLEGMVQFLV